MHIRIICFWVSMTATSLAVKAQPIAGCTDNAANNYNASAIINNGSCTYDAVTLVPILKFNQTAALSENSGMIFWNNLLWQHNDGGDAAAIYAMDTISNRILRTITLNGVTNIDWEDMTQDETHIYIGDFGNNANGSRTDLKIYKLEKSAITASSGDTILTPEIIAFSYPDQTNTGLAIGANKTDFDCEAMIAYDNGLFLFTKQWTGNQTALYEIPKTAGNHAATRSGTLNVNGMITGADVFPATRTIVLTGYNASLTRFIYLLYDFNGTEFFGGNKRKVTLGGALQQTESIAFVNEHHAFIGTEAALFPQRLETINLAGLIPGKPLTPPPVKQNDPQPGGG